MCWEEMKATLILEDGFKLSGKVFGSSKQNISGEIVFQTGMVGYVESLTDPSYHGQILVLTYPLVGNYGVPDNHLDLCRIGSGFESSGVWPVALVVDWLCDDYSHWSATQSLDTWLTANGVLGLAGIDTRALTKHIREHGAMKAKIVVDEIGHEDLPFVDINQRNLVSEVSRKSPETFNPEGLVKIAAIDCGIKYNQIRCLVQLGCAVTVYPWNYDVSKQAFDGLFISNGPGDPTCCTPTIEQIKNTMHMNKPIMGICLGNQLMAKAAGFSTFKMKFGNRGHNQPCIHNDTGRCFITTQNHGFAVDSLNGPKDWSPLFTNANDLTNEGLVHNSKPFFSVQFHPEHMAGPMDMQMLFDVFVNHVTETKNSVNKMTIRERINKALHYEMLSTTISRPPLPKKILVLGSGGLTIGQAGEFDYSGAQALKALREEGVRTVLINPNIATVQTTPGFADRTYFLPITQYYVQQVIKAERPDGIYVTFGGQTGLNTGVDLFEANILNEYNVQILGTPIQSIIWTEDREKFASKMEEIGEKVAPSQAATTVQGAVQAAEKLGYPILVRAAYALGGLGSGFADNKQQLEAIAKQALANSSQVLVDKSLKGWKEIEYEVVRDAYDNCITLCNMENLDPLGIHTGESIVVAPSQTLSNIDYQILRTCAIKVIRHLGIVGECNIQFAVNPNKPEVQGDSLQRDYCQYYIIEVNARLSRSSALASKATGYPLAYVAAKLGLNFPLPQLKNLVTGKTTACFEPSLDYCVVKIPRWDLGKFARVSTQIGSSMKSVGEVMGIGRHFEEAFQKALRMVDDSVNGFDPKPCAFDVTDPEASDKVEEQLRNPTDKRVFYLASALYSDFSVEKVHSLTKIDPWFLGRLRNLMDMQKSLESLKVNQLSMENVLGAKQAGFSDKQIAEFVGSTHSAVQKLRIELGVTPFVKQIDTVAAEWPATTNYLYLTYNASEHDIQYPTTEAQDTVIVLGSGVYRIGSSVEFDCCAVTCVKSLAKMGMHTVMVNCNPETVSTDYDMCDRLYFEEISLETVVEIYELEQPRGVILCMGGQLPNNIAIPLDRAEVRILGTSPSSIDVAENRFKFSRMLDHMQISQPRWKNNTSLEEALVFCHREDVGYPCLVRPSYVLSGAAMNVAHSDQDLEQYLQYASEVSKDHPVVVSKFIVEAKEIDVDAVAFDGQVVCMAVSEHVENAGVHSGDATLVTPPQDLNSLTLQKIRVITEKIAGKLQVNGPFNMQLIAKDDELKVIECNLRVSRSFPFVSKTLGHDFIDTATKCIMRVPPTELNINSIISGNGKVGVKVPQFSFSRLTGADAMLGVEMASTGEVGCFGKDRYEAYLKAWLSTGFTLPKKSIMLSIGSYKAKIEMLPCIRHLYSMGYKLYASTGTADFYNEHKIEMQAVEWPFEEGGDVSCKASGNLRSIADHVAHKEFDLIINLPRRGVGSYRVSSFMTHGYKTRRMAIDNGIPLVTDIKCAKMLIEALIRMNGTLPRFNALYDCVTLNRVLRLPGLIDVHVHMREPGAEHKETWLSGTSAALAGGITMVLAMPNTKPAIVDQTSLDLVTRLAKENACCDYGIYVGATATNAKTNRDLARNSVALKMYLNDTFTTLKLDSTMHWRPHFKHWPESKPIVCHSEGTTMAAVLWFASHYKRPVHFAHVSTEQEIHMIREAKEGGQRVTCEVAPHHLFLCKENVPPGWQEVRPRLSTASDMQALWNNMKYIDCFATDHAPHTRDEKGGENPPPGFPGLETMLPLLLNAVNEGKLTVEDIVARLHTNPRRIFNLPLQERTFIEVDLDEPWTIDDSCAFSKANWTPFAGMKGKGVVRRVILRGEDVFVDGRVLVKGGFGKNVLDTQVFPARVPDSPSTDASSDSRASSPDFKLAYRTVMAELASSSKKTVMEEFASKKVDAKKLQKRLKDEVKTVPKKLFECDRLAPLVIPAAPISPVTRDMVHSDTVILQAMAGSHVLTVNAFSKQQLSALFAFADIFKASIENDRPVPNLMNHKIMCLVFYEVSTRTSCSFEVAIKRLGGKSIKLNDVTSSVKKGETLEDTIRTMAGYSDVVVLRHPEKGAAERASKACHNPRRIPFINAGDGTGEHPTQALLDVYTIRTEIGTVNDLTIVMIGDLKHSRTVHSLAKLLCLYQGISLHYVSPPGLRMPEEIQNYITQHNPRINQKQFAVDQLREAVAQADVIYATRIQKERFDDEDEYKRCCGQLVLTPSVLGSSKAIVMHPLPRMDEISTELDEDDRAAYFRQAEYGVYVRMALLAAVSGAVY